MSKVISLRVDDELAMALEFYAAGEDSSLSDAARKILVSGLYSEQPAYLLLNIDTWIESRQKLGKKVSEETISLKKNVVSTRERALSKMPDYPENSQLEYLIKALSV